MSRPTAIMIVVLTMLYRRQVGFAALREFVMQRPSLRSEAMTMLLELTTHPGMVYRSSFHMHLTDFIPSM
jgi:symplekin